MLTDIICSNRLLVIIIIICLEIKQGVLSSESVIIELYWIINVLLHGSLILLDSGINISLQVIVHLISKELSSTGVKSLGRSV